MTSNWETVQLGDVAETLLGKTLPRGAGQTVGGAPYLRNINVQWGRVDTDQLNSMPFDGIERTKYELRRGDLLVCEGGEIGRLAIIDHDMPGVYFQNAIHRVRADAKVNPWYLALSLEHLVKSGGLEGISTRVTIAHLNQTKLRELPVGLPPLVEQGRIVDLIGALDEAIAAADEVITHNRSVADRVSNDAYAKAMSGELPMTSLINVIGDEGFIQTGPFGSQLHSYDYVEIGTPVVMPTNIKEGRVNVDGIARISDKDLARLKKHIVRPGDIVWSRRGDVTRFAEITEEDEPMICGTGCLLIRPSHPKITSWLTVWLSSKNMQTIVIDRAVGATMLNLNTKILGSLPVAMPEADSPLPAVLASLGLSRAEAVSHAESLRTLRSEMLTSLLSGAHTIPESSYELMDINA